MKKAIIYIHGKGGNHREAEQYRQNCPECNIYGVDYQDDFPWVVQEKILDVYNRLNKKYDCIYVLANSIGAYFSMHTLQKADIKKAFFISPILDMERLILDMMRWAEVSEDSYRFWRNPVMEIFLLCQRASYIMGNTYRDSVWGK